MWVPNLKRTAASVALICLVAGCQTNDRLPFEPELIARTQLRAWVAIEPTQCLTNAWEADWLEQHGGDYAAYPKDPTRPGLEPEEIAIITSYYARQGVVVFETATAPKYTAVCMACSCPEGHTMFLRVREEDVETMIGFGYRVEAPPATD
jgi:hypothetical protein